LKRTASGSAAAGLLFDRTSLLRLAEIEGYFPDM
jgi:hypothetical protein